MCLNLTKKEAIEIFKASNQKVQEMLIAKFGIQNFQKDWKSLRTIQDVMDDQGVKLCDIQPYKCPQNADEESINAYAVLIYVLKAINENQEPNWDNDNERKFVPYFKMSGSGFSYHDYGNWHTSSDVGSRLCYLSLDKLKHTVAQPEFLELYRKFMKK